MTIDDQGSDLPIGGLDSEWEVWLVMKEELTVLDRARLQYRKQVGLLKPALQDQYPIKGKLGLVLTDKNGKIKVTREYRNTITVLLDATVADRMAGGTDALIDYTAVGTTSGGKTTSSTVLEAQVVRVQNDSNTQGAGAADNDVVHVSTFGAGVGTGALVEAGLFTDAGAGATLMAWQDFSVINKGAGDTLTVTWTITYGAS